MYVETNYNIQKFRNRFSLPLVIQSVGTHEQEPVIRPHGAPFHQVLWVTQGTGMFKVGNRTFTLHAGQGFFMRGGVPHTYYAVGDGFVTAWFSFFGCDGLPDYYDAGESFLFDVPPFLPSRFKEFFAFCRGNSTPISRSAMGYALLSDLLAAHFSPIAPLAQQVDALLESRFGNGISLDEIAAAVGVSKYTLCHRYKEERGVSVMEQLRRIRIAKAKQYLTATSEPIAAIGQRCGFESPSYFTKTFREATGVSPGEFRHK